MYWFLLILLELLLPVNDMDDEDIDSVSEGLLAVKHFLVLCFCFLSVSFAFSVCFGRDSFR